MIGDFGQKQGRILLVSFKNHKSMLLSGIKALVSAETSILKLHCFYIPQSTITKLPHDCPFDS